MMGAARNLFDMPCHWYPGGQIMLIEEYTMDQLESGSYYKLGSPQAVSHVVAGRGTATLFDLEGRLERKIIYENGKPHS